jgi:ABC-type Fe3+ transport system substrate-binding protein
MKKMSTKVLYLVSSVAILLVLSPAIATPKTPLERVIEGAKMEGTVTMISPIGFPSEGYVRLRKEIRQKYGVDLKFKYERGWIPKDYTKALTEHKAGVTPTFDLFVTSPTFVLRGIKAGILEKVDWEPLLAEGTPPEAIVGTPPQLKIMHGYGLIWYDTISGGIIYNPTKIPADEVPVTMMDLANPKWKGDVGVHKSTTTWLSYCWAVGKEKGFSTLRAIVKNGGIVGNSQENIPRYLMGEIKMTYISAQSVPQIRAKGVPAEWQTLYRPIVQGFLAPIRKGAPHPNAAKLVNIYLASPEGFKLLNEVSGKPSIYYPNNITYDILLKDKKRGVTPIFANDANGILPFSVTEEAKPWEKEIKAILAGR